MKLNGLFIKINNKLRTPQYTKKKASWCIVELFLLLFNKHSLHVLQISITQKTHSNKQKIHSTKQKHPHFIILPQIVGVTAWNFIMDAMSVGFVRICEDPCLTWLQKDLIVADGRDGRANVAIGKKIGRFPLVCR